MGFPNLPRLILLCLSVLVVSCASPPEGVLNVEADPEVKAELDHFILQTIRDSGEPFNWDEQPDEVLFKGLAFADNILVVGYEGGDAVRDELLERIYASERVEPEALGEPDDVLKVRNDALNFLYVTVKKWETLMQIRSFPGTAYAELSGYPIDLELMAEYAGTTLPGPAMRSGESAAQTANMILDPYNTDIPYIQQVGNYSGGAARTLRRHNVDQVYAQYGIYGEGIGVAVLDNGIRSEDFAFMQANGYGARFATGYYNPLWFLPFTEPDGPEPQSPDVLFISQFIDGQWLHGFHQNEQVLMTAPNAAISSVRTSPLVLVLTPSQILGIINGLLAVAEDPDIRVASMSMGSLWYINHMDAAIQHFNAQNKILVAAAGTSFIIIRDLLGVIFPARESHTLAATGIENREETGGEFVLGESSHAGPEVDYCVEDHGSSSEATSQLSAMVALVWSANPNLTREEVLDVLKQSSYFYQQTGQRDPVFGWGTVDVLAAVELARTL